MRECPVQCIESLWEVRLAPKTVCRWEIVISHGPCNILLSWPYSTTHKQFLSQWNTLTFIQHGYIWPKHFLTCFCSNPVNLSNLVWICHQLCTAVWDSEINWILIESNLFSASWAFHYQISPFQAWLESTITCISRYIMHEDSTACDHPYLGSLEHE